MATGEDDAGPVRIRQASLDDRAAICHVHCRAIRQVCADYYTPDQIEAWAGLLQPDRYTDVIREREFLVAEAAGSVIGFGQLHLGSGEVEAVYVDSGFVRRGVGGMLLARLEAAARSRGLAKLELSSTLNAVEFYKHAGFEPVGRTDHELPSGVRLPCVKMRKIFQAG